jgi:PAS domain S-box-containing protein
MVKDTRRAEVGAGQATGGAGASDDVVVETSRSGVVTGWNPAAARWYGYAAEEIVGRSAEVLVPAEDREEEAAILRRVVAGEQVGRYRADRLCRDGTVLSVWSTVSPILDSAGAVVAVVTTSAVVGELEEARDRFEARMDRLRVQAHHAQERFEDRVDRERLQAHDAQEQFEVQVDRERAQVQNDLKRFEVQVDQERALAHEAQERQDVKDRGQARADAERRDLLQVQIDAERAQARSDKEHLKAQLKQSQRLEVLGQLAGGVAHDFNNLLAVILNYAAFVTDELAAGSSSNWEAASRDVRQIERAAQRASALTRQLLAFARREVIQPRVLNVNEVVTEVEQLLRRTMGEDVTLRTELAADLLPVLADVGQIEQVLLNLAVNARDAMSGGGTLSIDTANIDGTEGVCGGRPVPPGRRVRLRVSDTGTGMPADVVDHIFEPFYTTKPEGAGTGLGLSTVYGIVTQAKGSISVTSRPGAGTTFTITIPVTDQLAAAVQTPLAYDHRPTGQTVLVIEDEDALRDVTERIFTRGGYHVLTAADGAEGVALAAGYDGEIHLLVTDVVMPNMVGDLAAEKIRRIKPDIEVLYMSGYAQPALASQGRLDRGVNLIEKPFAASALIEKAGQILHGHCPGSDPTETVEPSPPVGTPGLPPPIYPGAQPASAQAARSTDQWMAGHDPDRWRGSTRPRRWTPGQTIAVRVKCSHRTTPSAVTDG